MSEFFLFIKSLPEIFSAFIELKKLWEQYLDAERRATAMKLLGDAINVARTQKDTTQLTSLVNKIISGQPLS